MLNQIKVENLLNDTNGREIEKITENIFKIDDEVIEILAVNYDLKILKFRHNHNTHEVQFKNHLDLTLDKMGIKRSFESISKDVKAPMPGKVLNIMVKPGDELKKGEPLLILEAMKMENIIKSDSDCIIDEVLINSNQNVEKNELLISLK